MVWSEEALTVEMDEVRWIVTAPDIGLPRDVGEVFAHLATTRKQETYTKPTEELLNNAASSP